MHKKILTVVVLLALVAVAKAQASEVIFEEIFNSNTNLQNSGAIIEVQENNQEAAVFSECDNQQSLMYFWLTKEQFQEKILTFTIEVKGQDLSNNFVFGLQGTLNGNLAWPAGTGEKGTFDWKKISFTVDFSEVLMESAAVRIGLQNTSGTLLVKSLTVEDIPPEESIPVSGTDQTSEIILEEIFNSNINLQNSGATVELQEDNREAVLFSECDNQQSIMYFWLTKEQFQERILTFTIEVKGQDLSNNFVFGLQGTLNGSLAWPAGTGEKGTFDWKKISFTVDFSEIPMESAAVRIGLQNTSGTLLVRSLIVEDITPSLTAPNSGEIPFSSRYGSVDFSQNEFHVPDYNTSINLIQNPSFEAGSDFWTPACWGALENLPEDKKPLLTIDTTTAFDGRASICQRVIEGGKGGWSPATFAIPLEEGEEYTLSFYAKTDNPDVAIFEVAGITDVWDIFLPRVRYELSTGWKRYIYQFTSLKKMVQLQLGSPREANPCKIWIDAVQLEKGMNATDFTRLPVAVTLVTDSTDNLSQPGEKANARMMVSTSKPSTGSISYVIKDFFANVVDKATVPFTTFEADKPVELPLAACDSLDSGSYTIQATAELSDGFSHTTWHRLMRMHYITEPSKHSQLFCIPEMRGAGNWETAIVQAKKIGFGSFEFSNHPPTEYKQLLDQYGFVWSSDIFRLEGWPPAVEGKYRMADANFGLEGTLEEGDISRIAADIVQHCIKTVQDNPNSVLFETVNEPFCQTEQDIANTVAILRQVRDEIHKIKSDILFMTPDCANIDHTMKYLETFFEKGGADICDVVGLHTYRGHPDALDGDLSKVISLTDTYKPDADIWSTEGGYYNTYIIPDIGFDNVTHGGDHYRAGNISYDLGLGEKIALAYQTRFRVQALKYASRLKRDADWNDVSDWRTSFGIQRIPTSGVFATNVPARFLGNADFVADLDLPKAMRGYLFKDNQERPVAVLWYTDDSETLYKNANQAKLMVDSSVAEFEAFNIVGSSIENKEDIVLSGYPVYLRGEQGDIVTFKQNIENAQYIFPEVGEQLAHTFEFKEDGSFTAKFSNRFNKELKGELVCNISGEEVLKTTIDVEPYGTFEHTISFPASSYIMTTTHYSYRFNGDDDAYYAKDLEIKYFTARNVIENDFNMNGNWEKWDAIDKISADTITPATAKDLFAVDTGWVWNNDYLYCFVDVKDQTFEPSETIQFPTKGDCVELFFDGYADSVMFDHHSNGGYAEDDQYYTMWFNNNGVADAYRSQEAHWQLSFNKPGRAPEIKSSYELTSTGYRMQTAFPMREIKPVDLVDGGLFGMNIAVHNKDVGTAIYGSGEVPLSWRSPENYVFIFLEKSNEIIDTQSNEIAIEAISISNDQSSNNGTGSTNEAVDVTSVDSSTFVNDTSDSISSEGDALSFEVVEGYDSKELVLKNIAGIIGVTTDSIQIDDDGYLYIFEPEDELVYIAAPDGAKTIYGMNDSLVMNTDLENRNKTKSRYKFEMVCTPDKSIMYIADQNSIHQIDMVTGMTSLFSDFSNWNTKNSTKVTDLRVDEIGNLYVIASKGFGKEIYKVSSDGLSYTKVNTHYRP